jgi:hypothetical protein
MDPTHVFLGGMLVFSILVAVVGFWLIIRRQEKDEAIDAATFLALRELKEYVRRSK